VTHKLNRKALTAGPDASRQASTSSESASALVEQARRQRGDRRAGTAQVLALILNDAL
jgi:hypothetical protein